MNFSRILKFTCSGAILAAGIYAYAEDAVEDNAPKIVQLSDTGKTKISWEAFVNAINNPEKVEGKVDPTSSVATTWDQAKTNLQAAKDKRDAAQGKLDEAQEQLQAAKDKIPGLKDAQGAAASAVTDAQAAYTAANNEYNEALGNQSVARDSVSSREKMLATANQNVANKKAAIEKVYDDQIQTDLDKIAANQSDSTAQRANIESYQRLMNALVTTTYEKETAPWLTKVQDVDGPAFETRFVNKPADTATTTVTVYYKLTTEDIDSGDVDDDDNPIIVKEYTLQLSFVPQTDWDSAEAATAFQTIKKAIGGSASTVIDFIEIHFGFTDGKPNYGKNSVISVSATRLSQVAKNVNKQIQNIDVNNYQVDSDKGKETISNQALYDEYKKLKQEAEAKINGTTDEQGNPVIGYTQANVNLRNAIGQLRSDKAADLLNNTELKALEKTASDISAKLKGFENDLAGYTATVNKYRAISTPAEEGKPSQPCYDTDGKTPISYLSWLNNQIAVKQAAQTAAATALANAQEEQSTAQNDVNTYSTDWTNADNSVTAYQTAYNAAESAYNTAQEAADAAATAEAQVKYNDVTLTGDVTVANTINSYSGTIHGGDNIVEVTAPSMFGTFNGTLSDVAINGKTFNAKGNEAIFTNVARWDSNTNSGVFYGESGSTSFEDLGELGFAAREKFGVSFVDKKLVAKNENTTVYNISVYSSATTQPTQNYVTITNDKKFVSAKNTAGFTLADNRFAKSATSVERLGLTNVFYGDNNTCENVKIVDKKEFYCPVQVAADKVTLDRVFTDGPEEVGYGYNSVCLPFDFNYTFGDKPGDIISICRFDKVENGRFWFRQINKEKGLPANTPGLVVVKNGGIINGLELGAAIIAQTDKYVFTDEGATNDPSVSYGTLQPIGASELNGQAEAEIGNIYGLTTNGSFKKASAEATFPAFRMAIGTTTPVIAHAPGMHGAPAQSLDEYGIGILDENGKDITEEVLGQSITTGIEEATAPALEIVGGQGEISITSEANYGKVQIFTVDGRVAASANVVEGTTTVSLAHGLYIVMGQKVLVK